MRCCKICGCYLPDGVSECLACGYDEKRGYPVDEIPTTTLDENTLGFHYGYGLSQWNGEVRSPMGIVQAPVMPTKTENIRKVYTAATSGSCINVVAKSVPYNEENARNKYAGFSYSDKPKHGVPGGSIFYEIDTGNTYMFIKEYRMWFLLYKN